MSDIKTTVEFEETVQALDAELSKSSLWSGRFAQSNLRTAILDMFSIFLTSNQFASEASLLESFVHLARRNSSVYAGTMFLGVRITRRTPAGTTCEFHNKGQAEYTINKWDTFQIGESTYFSRKTYIISANEKVEVDLFEGLVRTKVFTPNGETFTKLFLQEEGFTVSDSDMDVESIDGDTGIVSSWTRTEENLFTLTPTDLSYFDITTGKGDVSIIFGDGTFGAIPKSTDSIRVTYAITSGVFGNNGLSDQKVTVPTKTVEARTISNVAGGGGVKDPEYYKTYAPIAHRSQGSFSDYGSWVSQIMLYPGVADCVVQSQRDIAPDDQRWMGVIRVCILPQFGTWGGVSGANPTSAKWTEFLKWISEKTFLTIQPYNPSAIMTDIIIDVYLNSGYRKEEWQKKCETLVQKLFVRNKNTLGKRLSRSDLDDALKLDESKRRRKEIDYVIIRSPEEDVVPSSQLQYVNPRNIRINMYESERRELL